MISKVQIMKSLNDAVDKATAWDAVAAKNAEIERLRLLLRRCLSSIKGGKWRDGAGLSAEAHPVWDDVKETLRPRT